MTPPNGLADSAKKTKPARAFAERLGWMSGWTLASFRPPLSVLWLLLPP